ncbi:MAG: hypothetical protein CL763_06890 [Chloroflexi bacterium]|nr:hypothetical protein [Chloroflexota bacterium]
MLEISFPYDSRIYCPRCGVNNIPGYEDIEEHEKPIEELVKDCIHFKFFGTWDTDGFVVDKENLTKKFNSLSEEEQEKFNDGHYNPFQNFLLKNLNNNYLQIEQQMPAPANMGAFTLYDLSAELEDDGD